MSSIETASATAADRVEESAPQGQAEPAVVEVLVEEISIDGMCGVY